MAAAAVATTARDVAVDRMEARFNDSNSRARLRATGTGAARRDAALVAFDRRKKHWTTHSSARRDERIESETEMREKRRRQQTIIENIDRFERVSGRTPVLAALPVATRNYRGSNRNEWIGWCRTVLKIRFDKYVDKYVKSKSVKFIERVFNEDSRFH